MKKLKKIIQKPKFLSYERMAFKRAYRTSIFFLFLYSVVIFFLHGFGYMETSYRGSEIFDYPMNFGGAATFGMMLYSVIICILILLAQYIKEPILADKSLWPKNFYAYCILEAFYISSYISVPILFVWMIPNPDLSWIGRVIILIFSMLINAFYLRLLFPALMPLYATHLAEPAKEKIY